MEPGGGWKVPSGPLPALLLAGVGRWARTADYLSVTLTLLLGAAGAVDVLVMSQRERATDLAVLCATGWKSFQGTCFRSPQPLRRPSSSRPAWSARR